MRLLYALILFNVAALTFSSKKGGSICETDWFYTGHLCLRPFQAQVTYQEANKRCKDLKATLATYASENENIEAKLLKNIGNFWIGLKRIKNIWKWDDNTSYVYSNWINNNAARLNQNGLECALDKNWGWENVKCSEKASYICQREARPTCRNGWEENEGHCYFAVSSKTLFKDAKRICEVAFSTLTSIRSPEEENFLRELAKIKRFWIGLRLEDDKWVWDDNSNMDYERWHPEFEENPNITDHIISFQNGWNTAKTETVRSSFICKYKLLTRAEAGKKPYSAYLRSRQEKRPIQFNQPCSLLPCKFVSGRETSYRREDTDDYNRKISDYSLFVLILSIISTIALGATIFYFIRTRQKREDYQYKTEEVEPKTYDNVGAVTKELSQTLSTFMRAREQKLNETLKAPSDSVQVTDEEGTVLDEETKVPDKQTNVTDSMIDEQSTSFSEARKLFSEKAKASEMQTKIPLKQTSVREEQRRVAEEQSKTVEEARKVSDEETKVSDEQTSVTEEQSRAAEEQSKTVEEARKVSDEEINVSDEHTSVTDEQSRVTEEQSKASNEESD